MKMDFCVLAIFDSYVGQKKLNQAVDAFQSKQHSSSMPSIDIKWKPYQIDPGTKLDGEEFEAYNVRRWGSSAWTMSLKQSGRRVGANFNNWKTWPNTLKAHQMIAFLTDDGIESAPSLTEKRPSSSECNAAIFDAMYECGENVSLVDTLIDIATERLGISSRDAVRLRSYLETDEGSSHVQREIRDGRMRYNIRGVPYFVIEGSKEGQALGRPYGFSGAQESSEFIRIFEILMNSME